jgi:hypothetical protein
MKPAHVANQRNNARVNVLWWISPLHCCRVDLTVVNQFALLDLNVERIVVVNFVLNSSDDTKNKSISP